MKNLLVCVGLMAATAGGVAFVVSNQARPVERGCPSAKTSDPMSDGPCLRCQGGVQDVTDLSASFAAKPTEAGEFISFDEPPLAKKPAEPREVLPAPREVKE